MSIDSTFVHTLRRGPRKRCRNSCLSLSWEPQAKLFFAKSCPKIHLLFYCTYPILEWCVRNVFGFSCLVEGYCRFHKNLSCFQVQRNLLKLLIGECPVRFCCRLPCVLMFRYFFAVKLIVLILDADRAIGITYHVSLFFFRFTIRSKVPYSLGFCPRLLQTLAYTKFARKSCGQSVTLLSLLYVLFAFWRIYAHFKETSNLTHHFRIDPGSKICGYSTDRCWLLSLPTSPPLAIISLHYFMQLSR